MGIKLPVMIIFLGGVTGAVAGWTLARALLPADVQFLGGIPFLVACCVMPIGLMGGLAVARVVVKKG